MKTEKSARTRIGQGFTLIEVLVVVAIISLLAAILIPSLSRARERVKITACLSNLRTLGQAMVMYAYDTHDLLPNANPPNVLDDEEQNTIVAKALTRKYVKIPAVFHCPCDLDPIPTSIETVSYTEPNSARVSYDFYSFWCPRDSSRLTRIKMAPLSWDIDGGSKKPTWLQNHGIKGGNVVFGDGHAQWQAQISWDKKNMPHPGNRYYPKD